MKRWRGVILGAALTAAALTPIAIWGQGEPVQWEYKIVEMRWKDFSAGSNSLNRETAGGWRLKDTFTFKKKSTGSVEVRAIYERPVK